MEIGEGFLFEKQVLCDCTRGCDDDVDGGCGCVVGLESRERDRREEEEAHKSYPPPIDGRRTMVVGSPAVLLLPKYKFSCPKDLDKRTTPNRIEPMDMCFPK